MDPINTGKRHRPNKSLFNGHVQVLLETIPLSTGRLNNEGFIESLYAGKEETVFCYHYYCFCKFRTNTTNYRNNCKTFLLDFY